MNKMTTRRRRTSMSSTSRRATVGLAADAMPITQIEGVAWDQAIVGQTAYVGGRFSTARPVGAAPGVNTTPRSKLLAHDLATGVNTYFCGSAPKVVTLDLDNLAVRAG